MQKLNFGIQHYSTNFPGTGGVIKNTAEDFRVIEVDYNEQKVTKKNRVKESGLYSTGVIERVNQSHDATIKKLCWYFGVKEGDLGFAGIKDKKAVISQEFSVYNPKRNRSKNSGQISTRLSFHSLYSTKNPVIIGKLSGNHFEIKINDCNNIPDDFEFDVKELSAKGFFNYYGSQRFGGTRPVNTSLGKLLIENNYKDAIDLFLGGESTTSDDKYRKLWRDTKDANLLLSEWLEAPAIEKRILKALTKFPENYDKAIDSIPIFLIRLWKNSLRSLIFNNYITKRGLELKNSSPLKGERDIKFRGLLNREIAIPSKEWSTPLNSAWKEVFSDLGVNLGHFTSFPHFSRFAFAFPEGLICNKLADSLSLQFYLPKGSYATILTREIIK